MQSASFEATFPIMGGLVWNRIFHAMYATPVTPRDVALGNLVWIAARLLLIATVFTIVIVLFGAALSPLVVFAIPVAALTGPCLRGTDRGLLGDPANARPLRGDLPLRHHAAVHLLRDVLPGEALPPFLQPLAWLTPLYHGGVLARGLSLGTIGTSADVRAGRSFISRSCWASSIVGTILAIRTISARLVRG